MARLQAVDDGQPSHVSATCDPDALITAAETTSPAWRLTCTCPHLTVQASVATAGEDVRESKVETDTEGTRTGVRLGVRFAGFQLTFDSSTDAWKVRSISIALGMVFAIIFALVQVSTADVRLMERRPAPGLLLPEVVLCGEATGKMVSQVTDHNIAIATPPLYTCTGESFVTITVQPSVAASSSVIQRESTETKQSAYFRVDVGRPTDDARPTNPFDPVVAQIVQRMWSLVTGACVSPPSES